VSHFSGLSILAVPANVVPYLKMATQLTSNHGTPILGDLSTGIAQSSDMDAVETLKAVQGIISTYLANGTTGGRSRIPTPESSPVPKYLEVSKREAVDVNAVQEVVVPEDTGPSSKTVLADSQVEDIGTVSRQQQMVIKGTEPARVTSQVSQTIRNKTADQLDRGVLNHAAARALDADNMESQGPATPNLNRDSKTNGIDIKPSPPSAPPLDQDRLLRLTSDITHNISQIATNDTARIKAVTDTLELAAALRPPGDTIMGWFANMSVISAVRLFLHWGAFDIIPPSKGESITYAKLATQVNADEGLISKSPLPPLHRR
jgi:hypothetical protein